MRRWLGLALSCSLVFTFVSVSTAPPAGAVPDVDVAACTVTGGASNSGVGLVPAPATYGVILNLSCAVAGSGDDGGNWSLTATAAGALDSCAEGFGKGWINWGTSQFDGAVIGAVFTPSFTYVRIGNAIHIVGTVNTTDDTHDFTADLVYIPTNPGCPDGGSGTVTGTATIADAPPLPTIDADGGPCLVSASMTYNPALGFVPGLNAYNASYNVNCVGVGDDAGAWTFAFPAAITASCQAEVGLAGLVGGISPEGPITGGTLAWTRAGPVMQVAGTIFAAGETHAFAAVLAWVSVPPVCGVPPAAAATATGPGALIDT